jgi:hypothetical protein
LVDLTHAGTDAANVAQSRQVFFRRNYESHVVGRLA